MIFTARRTLKAKLKAKFTLEQTTKARRGVEV